MTYAHQLPVQWPLAGVMKRLAATAGRCMRGSIISPRYPQDLKSSDLPGVEVLAGEACRHSLTDPSMSHDQRLHAIAEAIRWRLPR